MAVRPQHRTTIVPGTHIVSEGWAAYANIEQIQYGIYTHSVAVHDRNFVGPEH